MRRFTFILLLLCVTLICGFSQTPKLDSLKLELKKAHQDTTRCTILGALTSLEYDPKIWPIYNEELYQLSEKNFKTTNSQYLKKFYSIAYSDALNNRGFLAQELGNISDALQYYYKALKIEEGVGAKSRTATTLNNIAYIYMTQTNLDKALEFVKRALKLQTDLGDSSLIALSYNNIGRLYSEMKKADLSLVYYNKSLSIQQKLNNKGGIATSFYNISQYHLQRNEFETGLKYLKNALSLYEEIKDFDGASKILTGIAEVYLRTNKLNEALQYCLQSKKLSEKVGFVENKRNSSLVLYKVYKKLNKNKEALMVYEDYINMRDSIQNETLRKSAFENDLKYHYAKKASTDSVRIAETKKLTDAQFKQEKTQRFALYGGLILVGLFGAFMFNRFKVTQKQNVLIHEQKTELQKQKEIVEGHQKETLDSIHYAKRIQTALITNSNSIDQHFPNNFIYFNPKDIVSGDFYWATEHNHKFYLAICDSTGHGVPGAFMSLLNMGFLSEAIKEKHIEKPNEIFDYVRERLIATISNEGQKDGMDGILLCIDKKTNAMEYCAANNEPILITDGKIVELPKDKMPVGKGERKEKFTLQKLQLKPGDHLYLYTDGYADQFGGPKGKKFMYKRLNNLLLSLKDIPLQEQKSILEKTLNDWKMGLEQIDDVLIAGIKI